MLCLALLREETRCSAIGSYCKVVRAGLHLKDAEVVFDAGCFFKTMVTVLGAFIAGAVDPKALDSSQSSRVSKQHDGDLEDSQTEFIFTHRRVCATGGFTSVLDTELCGDHRDVMVALLLSEGGEESRLLGAFAQSAGAELSMMDVFELAFVS